MATGPAIHAAKDATSSVPIVMSDTLDAVGRGYVHSLAQPEGNITGLTRITTDVVGKRGSCSRRLSRTSPASLL